MTDLLIHTDAPGCINPDSERGKELGFTADLFDGYLFEHFGEVYVSLVVSKQERRGNVRALFDRLEAAFPVVKVPTPLGRMNGILAARGYQRTVEETPMGDCEVYVKRANAS